MEPMNKAAQDMEAMEVFALGGKSLMESTLLRLSILRAIGLIV